MNWIATAFEQLKARVEAHIPATNKALNDLDQRVTGAETYTQKSVESLEARIAALETSKVGGVQGSQRQFQGLLAQAGSCAQPDRAPL